MESRAIATGLELSAPYHLSTARSFNHSTQAKTFYFSRNLFRHYFHTCYEPATLNTSQTRSKRSFSIKIFWKPRPPRNLRVVINGRSESICVTVKFASFFGHHQRRNQIRFKSVPCSSVSFHFRQNDSITLHFYSQQKVSFIFLFTSVPNFCWFSCRTSSGRRRPRSPEIGAPPGRWRPSCCRGSRPSALSGTSFRRRSRWKGWWTSLTSRTSWRTASGKKAQRFERLKNCSIQILWICWLCLVG